MITFDFNNNYVSSRIAKNLLEVIPINLDQVHRYLSKAYLHLEGSDRIKAIDLDGSYQLLYDSARKSLTSIFALNGLKPSSHGGHSILYDVIIKCVPSDEILNFRKYDRMRRRRNFTEYLSDNSVEITAEIRDEDFIIAQYLYVIALEELEKRVGN